jgi:hypothetical protein
MRRTGWIVLAVWLIIGVLAAAQRHYYRASSESCSGVGTIAVNILAGPLNYVGADPKFTCR